MSLFSSGPSEMGRIRQMEKVVGESCWARKSFGLDGSRDVTLVMMVCMRCSWEGLVRRFFSMNSTISLGLVGWEKVSARIGNRMKSIFSCTVILRK